MKEAHSQIGLSRMCWLFGITRQGYYKHFYSTNLKQKQTDIVLKLVCGIRSTHPKLGCRKLYHLLKDELQALNIKVGRDLLFDLLRDNNLLIRKRKRKHITTWSGHPFKKYSNLIREYTPYKPNQLWVSDITYLKTNQGFLYLSLITDAYSRKIVGYDLANNLEAVNALQALKMAIKYRTGSLNELIHHSDRGIQYCTHEYIALLNEKGIRISMTEKGDPLENAIAERVNGIIKNEYLLNNTITDEQHAKQLLEKTVMAYNNHRPHLSCQMKTPDYVHDNQIEIHRLWKNYYKKVKSVNLLQD